MDKNTLKSWFTRGKKPLASQFAAWMDSYWHKDENLPISSIANLSTSLANKVNTSVFTEAINSIIERFKMYLQHIKLITYAELKQLRDDGYLTPGQLYCINDYITSVANDSEARSAGHSFDLIVQATSSTTLSERARAVKSLRDESYFSNSNLDAWDVWYCLDNDLKRFQWASQLIADQYYIYVDGQNHTLTPLDTYPETYYPVSQEEWPYAFLIENETYHKYAFSKNRTPEVGDVVYCTENNGDSGMLVTISKLFAGKGVIYRLIDEWGNDCPYDFKNIQFKRYKITNDTSTSGILSEKIGEYLAYAGENYGLVYDETDFIYAYTFCNLLLNGGAEDLSLVDARIADEYNNGYKQRPCAGNIINRYFITEVIDLEVQVGKQALNNICFIQTNSVQDTDNPKIMSNKFELGCCNMTLQDGSIDNSFMTGVYNIIAGYRFYANSFGPGCYCNTFGAKCKNNTFGSKCNGNIFGEDFSDGTIGKECTNITFGDSYTNCTVLSGISGDAISSIPVGFLSGVNYQQIAGIKTDGTYRIWNPAD